MFRSFWMAGFECATGFNRDREWIDQIAATSHDTRADEDFAACRRMGLRTAREGIRWPLVDRGLRYDFESFESRLAAAQRHGIELVYDLFHYGYPKSISDPMGEEFVERFADYCFETARFLRERADGPYYFTPVNEPSYFAWAAGEAAVFAPYLTGRAYDLKVQLIRAAIRGIDAIRSVLPEARIVNADPFCRVVTPPDRADLADEVRFFNETAVFESWDMLAGRSLPELGGSPAHLDIVGINYYWTNQWTFGTTDSPLLESDPRCWSLREVIRHVWQRYENPIVVSETSHSQSNKAWWLRTVADEAMASLREGIPLHGVCLYPILGMPEWHDQSVWAHMGLWEVADDGNRTLHRPMAEALGYAQAQTVRQRARLAATVL
ncbi:MAG: family 1 glycosylhydrolase [Fimbriimonas sp.]